jgi:RNA polymerase sigma-70 factor (ECF subfamily)
VRKQDRLIEEIEAIYERDYGGCVRVAAAITGDYERGVEAVQEGFANAIQARHTFRGDGPLEGWVWRIVVNAARATVRRPADPTALEVAVADEAAVALTEVAPLVAALPERQRHAIFLRYYADLDYRTIAAVLGIEVGSVSATLAAAHRTIRSALKEVRQP